MPTRRIALRHSLAATVALVAVSGLAACGGDDEVATADDGSTVECDYSADGAAAKEVEAPTETAAAEGTRTATVATSVGDLVLTLDAAATPCTVNSFVSLAEQGYYDGTSCHRLADFEGFQMLQCGDPTGTGSGGPGYTFADELTGEETYPAGTLAMANAGPDTNGSQFFLVYGDTQLQPDYTVFGTFDQAGIDLLTEVGAAGNDGSNPDGTGRPLKEVTFESVTVS